MVNREQKVCPPLHTEVKILCKLRRVITTGVSLLRMGIQLACITATSYNWTIVVRKE